MKSHEEAQKAQNDVDQPMPFVVIIENISKAYEPDGKASIAPVRYV